ncbi:MAG: HlyC/CorC family transporter, partial [Verrucomicrobia bacterium]|nr:HlyC/CorC family transporter [Verrucomicrobiota bacterium]
MDADSLAPWLITLLLILFADYIAVTETSLAAVSRVRMKTLADRGDRKAEKVLYVLDHFDLAV